MARYNLTFDSTNPMSGNWQKIKALFVQAIELDPAIRASWLEERYRNQPEIATRWRPYWNAMIPSSWRPRLGDTITDQSLRVTPRGVAFSPGLLSEAGGFCRRLAPVGWGSLRH
jgi:hypothetical protein